jgi:DNA repair ATPase RecN
MKRVFALSALAVAFLVVSADTSFGQTTVTSWYTGNPKETVRSLESHTDKFAESLNKALDASKLDGTKVQDQINGFVDQFEEATDKLEQGVEDKNLAPGAYKEVVKRAKVINKAMLKYKLGPEAEADWALVRNDINSLGKSYSIVVKW